MTFTTRARDTWITGTIIASFIIAIALLIANVPGSPYRSPDVPMFLTYFLSVIIALLTYIRYASTVVWWEIIALGIWGEFSLFIAGLVSFLVMLGLPPLTYGYPGVVGEFTIQFGLFLTASIGLGIPYAIAGKHREDSVRASMLFAGAALVVLVIFLPLVSYLLPGLF